MGSSSNNLCSLDELESQEIAFMEQLSQEVLPDAPLPIGLPPESADANLKHVDDAILLAPPVQKPFWISHRDQFDRLTHQKSMELPKSQHKFAPFSPSTLFSPSAMSQDMSTASNSSAMDISRNSISSFHLTSPTGRMG
jgi:hypothetical protein